MTTPLPDPDRSDEQTELLRRAAEAAEGTRRNARILVIAFVVVPLAVLALWGIDSASKSASAASKATGIKAVEDVARSVGYDPRASTVSIQVSGICQNLEKMSVAEAATAMVTGFGDIRPSQAKAIVEAAAREVC